MPGPSVDRFVVCAENGLGGKVLEHVLERIVYTHDALGDHQVADPFAPLDAALGATAARRRRRDVPALAQRVAGAHGKRNAIRGGFVNMSLQTDARRSGAGGRRRAWPTTSRGCCPTWRRSAVRRFARSCSSGARRDRPVVPGARRRARPVRVAVVRARRRRRARRWRCSRSNGTACSTTADLDRAASGTSASFEPDPARHERYAYRQTQFEAAYTALLPISEALWP